MRRRTPWLLGGGLGLLLGAQLAGRQAGSTRAERHAHRAGDELVAHPQVVTDHAITIAAPPERVWPWLAQMGWHRAGWYTPRWVDRLLFPGNWPSRDRLDRGLVGGLHAGGTVPDGPPGTAFFLVETADPPHQLVLHSTTHVPASWRSRLNARIDWTWSFTLTEVDGETRLHLRVRGRTGPWWLTAGYVLLLVPADLVMATGMLRGLRDRCEAWAWTPDATQDDWWEQSEPGPAPNQAHERDQGDRRPDPRARRPAG